MPLIYDSSIMKGKDFEFLNNHLEDSLQGELPDLHWTVGRERNKPMCEITEIVVTATGMYCSDTEIGTGNGVLT